MEINLQEEFDKIKVIKKDESIKYKVRNASSIFFKIINLAKKSIDK